MGLQNLAEIVRRKLKNSASTVSTTVFHSRSLSAGFDVESGINVAETSMRVYKTSSFERVKNVNENIVDSLTLFCYGEPNTVHNKEQG